MIDGKSMIRRVYEQAVSCSMLNDVVVATDDSSIEKHVTLFGGKALMTSASHRSGTERCSEVCMKLRKEGPAFDVVVNIQGDEPYIDPAQISQVVGCFGRAEVQIASLMKRISREDELSSPNVVKVVTGISGRALYFSRAAVPYVRDAGPGTWLEHQAFYKHIGIYGYRADILMQIVKLPPSGHEIAESLEQLRWLDNGYEVTMAETQYESVAIDTPSDLLKLTNRQ